jgi:hypothetical protein
MIDPALYSAAVIVAGNLAMFTILAYFAIRLRRLKRLGMSYSKDDEAIRPELRGGRRG